MAPAHRTATFCALLCLTAAPLRVHAEQGKPEATKSAAAQSATELPEPPPAPLLNEEEPKPEPLKLEEPKPPVEAEKPAPQTKAERPWRPYRAGAWTSFGVTLALSTTGTVLGVLAQQRSDELGRLTGIVEDGQPPIYDAAHRMEYETQQREGLSFNRGAIASFAVAGVAAITTGLLFWELSKRAPKEERVAILTSGSSLFVRGRF